MIKENVAAVRAIIADSARKSGREPSEITLIGVTKNMSVMCINELLASGISEIGENRVQEFLPKYEYYTNEDSQDLENRPSKWHFIGHLQRNKVKFVTNRADLIHSVDSELLALEINRHGEKIGKVMNILAEINISQESSKFGISPKEILKFVEKLGKMRFLGLSGLMCVAPFVENSEENRVFFTKMRKLMVDINDKCIYHAKLVDLSMGMSGDFATAIEEGATMVRLGTALFGERGL